MIGISVNLRGDFTSYQFCVFQFMYMGYQSSYLDLYLLSTFVFLGLAFVFIIYS